MSEPMMHVVVGVLINQQQQVLMALRPSHKHLGGLWEFPGGKLEPGEQAFTALQREFKEELNISISQAEPMLTIPYRYPQHHVLLDVWQISNYQGVAIGHEGQKIAWYDIDDMVKLAYPPASQAIIDQLLARKIKD